MRHFRGGILALGWDRRSALIVTVLVLGAVWLLVRPSSAIVVVMSLQILLLAAGGWRWLNYGRSDPNLRNLMDLPGSEDQFPVEVTYKLANLRYGVDQGILSIAGGWLHFQGRRSEFNISNSELRAKSALGLREIGSTGLIAVDASEVYSPEPWGTPGKNLGSFSVRWHGFGRAGAIDIQPYASISGLPPGIWRRVREAFNAWRFNEIPSEGSSLLPPQTVQPEFLAALVRNQRIARNLRTIAILAAGVSFLVCFTLRDRIQSGFASAPALAFLVASALDLYQHAVERSVKLLKESVGE